MKLSQQQIDSIREAVEDGNKRFYNRKQLAKKYKVSEWTIKAVVNYYELYCKN